MEIIQGGIEKALELLRAAPTVAAQKAHLDWLRDQLHAAEKYKIKLEEENLSLLCENKDLHSELAVLKAQKQHIDLGSFLVSPNALSWTVLCPRCHKPLSQEGVNYHCRPCQYTVSVIKVAKSWQEYKRLKVNSEQK